MATLTTVYGDQYTDAYQSEPSVKLDVSLQGGRVRRAYGSYTVDAADEFGTSGLINMFKLPKGARLIECNFVSPDLGTTGIVDIGWDGGTNSGETADPNGIYAAQSVKAAAVDARMDRTLAGWNKKFDDEVSIQIDFTEATDAAAGLTIELEALYVVD